MNGFGARPFPNANVGVRSGFSSLKSYLMMKWATAILMKNEAYHLPGLPAMSVTFITTHAVGRVDAYHACLFEPQNGQSSPV